MLEKRWADAADLKRCVLCSRRRTTWCEFSPDYSSATPVHDRRSDGGLGRRRCRTAFIGRDQPGCETLLSEQLAHDL